MCCAPLPFHMKLLDDACLHADQRCMTTDRLDGLTEIAALLATALLRLQDRKSSRISAENRDNPLDLEPGSHGHGPREHEDPRT